jgi:DNA-binding response OmpR family regulator
MKKTKILVIDDDQDFADATKIILEQSGFDVIVAASGKQGLERTKKDNPDLVILDIMLPDINGFSVCRELKEDPTYSSLPIILLTAIGTTLESYAVDIAKQHQADVYIAKPIEKEELLRVVNDLLSRAKPAPKEERTHAKILLVDDDTDFLEATRQILAAHQYDVITAQSGDEGITKAKYENPDLILLDVIMPGKDGFSVCYELRKIPQTRPVPIIMLTAVGQQFSKPDYAVDIAIDHLADDFIDKPVDAATLIKKIEKHLRFLGR